MRECVHSIHALLLVRAEFPNRSPTAAIVHRWQMVDYFSDFRVVAHFDVTGSCVVLVYGSPLVGVWGWGIAWVFPAVIPHAHGPSLST